MTPERYNEISALLQAEGGEDVVLPYWEWKEFWAMVPRPEKQKAEVRYDNYIAGHAYAYCELHGEQVGPKYGYGVWDTNEATARAAYDVAFHNSMYHKEEA